MTIKSFFWILLAVTVISCSKEEKSAESRLADLEVNGTTVPGFSPEIKSYEYRIEPNDPFPIVTAFPMNSEAKISIHNPPSVPGSVTCQVRAENEACVSFYYINFGYDFGNGGGNGPIDVPGEDVFYHLEKDGFGNLSFAYNDGTHYNKAQIVNGVLEIEDSTFIHIDFNLTQQSADYQRVYLEVDLTSDYKAYAALNGGFNLSDPNSYVEVLDGVPLDLKQELTGFGGQLDIQLIVRDADITHLRVSGDR